jgi:hypothetical protein
MRRMMHAAAILLAIATQIQAQIASTTPNLETPHSLRPDLNQSAEVHSQPEMNDTPAKQLVYQNTPAETQFNPRESSRNYSQLASYMSCNDWSPNLWNNYACERAAIATRISQHVDNQCKCFESHHCKLHSQASGCGACDEGKCNVGTGAKLVNRYRQPVSTLYSASSDSCGPACSSGCADSHHSGIGGHFPSYPASALRPTIANPPRDRVASPVTNDRKGTFSVLNTQPSPSTLR